MKQKILITGGAGYIGKSIYKHLQNTYDITCITRQDFDLTAFQAMNKFFQDKYFDVVIHCAVQGGSRLKVDSYRDMDVNLTMYYNLLQHKSHYKKLIHLGSGAETYSPDTPYGFSKNVIAKSITEVDNFYNIVVYAIFDENELDTRFIKCSVKNYIESKPIFVMHNQKKMDFFYMKDFITLIQHYIEQDSSILNKIVHCSYDTAKTLNEIAEFINNLSTKKVSIFVSKDLTFDYISNKPIEYNLSFIGLEQGIINVYNKLI